MTFTQLVARATRAADRNSPVLLSAMAMVGTVSTAYLSAKAGHQAAAELARHNERADINGRPRPDRKEQAKLVWAYYIAPASTVAGTIVAIYGANKISSHRTAAIAAAYGLTEKAFNEYRDKVVEKIGENKEREVRDEIAQDQIKANPKGDREVIILPGGDQLCFEAWTARYFMSTMEDLKKAQNDINYKILRDDYATLSEFYNKIGLPPTQFSDELGWNVMEKLELQFSAALDDEGKPCLSISYYTEPVHNFHPLH